MSHTEVGEGLHDDGGRRHGDHSAEEDAVDHVEAEDVADAEAGERHTGDDNQCGDHRRTACLHQFAEGELKADREHEHHDAEVGPELDVLHVGD